VSRASACVRRLVALAAAVCLASVLPAMLSAQAQEDAKARGFVQQIAGTVFNWAWPTAKYERVTINGFRTLPGGYDATVRLIGQSNWGGSLWMDVTFMLRNGRLDDVRVTNHNAVLAAPFSTAKMLGSLVANMAQSYAASSPAATAKATAVPVRSSYGLTIANDCFLPTRTWVHYRSENGTWVTGNWDTPGFTSSQLLSGDRNSSLLAVTSRVVYSYTEPTLRDTRYAWSGDTDVPYNGTTLRMRTDTLRDDGTGKLVLARNCTNIRRLGVVVLNASDSLPGNPTYSHGARIREVQPGFLAERVGLRSGDVIYEINGQPVRTSEDLTRYVIWYQSEALSIQVLRDRTPFRIQIPVDPGR
jgi:hypothetical protein